MQLLRALPHPEGWGLRAATSWILYPDVLKGSWKTRSTWKIK